MPIIKNIATGILLLLLYSCTESKIDVVSDTISEPVFEVVVTHKNFTDSAWGYVIEMNKRPFIKQFTIPALQGNQLFESQQQAALVGKLVALKLNNGKHPTISTKELDSLGIKPLTHVIEEK